MLLSVEGYIFVLFSVEGYIFVLFSVEGYIFVLCGFSPVGAILQYHPHGFPHFQSSVEGQNVVVSSVEGYEEEGEHGSNIP